MGFTCYILHLSLWRCLQNHDKAKPNPGKLAPVLVEDKEIKYVLRSVRKLAQLVNVPVTNPGNLGLIPGSHMLEGELLQVRPLVYTYIL